MSATNWNIDYPRCRAIDHSCSVDTHSWNGGVTVVLSLSPMKAANTSVMHKSNQITVYLPYFQDHKSLTLRCRSFSQWGSDHGAGSFAYESCRYIGYEYERPNRCVISVLTKPRIVDALLTLILTMAWRPCCCLFCL